MNVSVISRMISALIILLVVVGPGETENSVSLNRDKRMTYNQQCTPNNECGKGYGDCETDRDCRWGLLCGKNNCLGEFGSYSPQGIPWERKDDCCTDNSNYCDPADRLPSSRRACCSPSNPCPFSHGDCDKDADCESGLICGDNNCKDFYTGAGNKDDCCTYPENGGNPPNGGLQQCSPNNQCGKGFGDCETDQDCRRGLFCGKNNCKGEFGARAPDGSFWDEKDDCCTDNRHYCNQANLFPWWRRTCCSPNNPCPFKHGDCGKDSDCVSNLVCGDNNCKDFHVNAGDKDDCCTYPDYKKKKRSVEVDEIGGSQLSGCEAEPSYRCCTRERSCALGGGDCTRDADCQEGLVCGSNNCRNFHPNVDKKMDCCVKNPEEKEDF